MACGLAGGVAFINADGADTGMAVDGIYHHAGGAGIADQIKPGMTIDAGIQQPVNLTAQQVVNQVVLVLPVVAGVPQQQHAAMVEGFTLQCPCH
ncbi:hypothetical protein D3C78_1618860 [compost metagenome]